MWFFARQTYADISLGRTEEGRAAASKYTPMDSFRAMAVRTVPAKAPQDELDEKATSGWVTVDRKTALGMSGAAFYLGQDLAAEQDIPIGIVDVNMGPYFAIGCMSEQGLDDTQEMHSSGDITWLRKSMPEELEERESGKTQKDMEEWNEERNAGRVLGLHPLKNPTYPSCGYNAVINPLTHEQNRLSQSVIGSCRMNDHSLFFWFSDQPRGQS